MLAKRDQQEIKEFVLRNIVAYCDKCGTQYKPENLTIVYNSTNSIVVQATCPKCGAKYIVQLMHPLNTAQKIPILLDISPMEFEFYLSLPPVNADTVLTMHKILSKSRLTLKEFFKELDKYSPKSPSFKKERNINPTVPLKTPDRKKL